jgi:ferredoxin--NADP+ reductase
MILHDQKDIPPMTTQTASTIALNLYKQANPLHAVCLENTRLTPEGHVNDVRHVVLSLDAGNYPYTEGQSAGILPPGQDPNGSAHKLRLYSIASPAVGETQYPGHTLALCVKRVVYQDEQSGETRYGVCSNYICDLKPGDTVNMTGPVGKAFVMPETPNANLIMFATGTGIAPFRGFLHTRYNQRQSETGQSILFFGIQKSPDFLYEDELNTYEQYPGYQLKLAISREQQTADGQKMYIQNRLFENRAEVLKLLQEPNTYVYMCGLKGMEKGIIDAFETAANEAGLDWAALHSQLKTEHRWHVEVY